MRTVRINKGELVDVLTKNRRKHKEDYEKAFREYREEALVEIALQVAKLKDGERIHLCVNDRPPESHEQEYDLALMMLNMSVDQVIELTAEQFDEFVNDNWNWKRGWNAMNMKYLTK